MNTGGPAFPPMHDPEHHASGMTLRDYFAAKAMQGFFERLRATQYVPHDQVAHDAYAMADAMLKARKE